MKGIFKNHGILYFILTLVLVTWISVPDAIAVTYKLSWDSSIDEQYDEFGGYRIYYRSLTDGQTGYSSERVFDVGKSLAKTIETLEEGKVYGFVVRAYDVYGLESKDSNEVFTLGIKRISSNTIDGAYNENSNPIDITVNFTGEVVLSGGSLILTLDTGDEIGINRIDVAGDNYSATGFYTIGAGDNSSRLTVTNIMLSSGATLKNTEGVHCDLSIPNGSNLDDFKNIVIDTIAPVSPVVSMQNGDENVTNDVTPTWVWTTSVAAVEFRYQLDGENSGSWTVWTDSKYTGSYTGTGFNHGETHTLYVQQRDKAGNWSASGSKSITIDTMNPPAPTISMINGEMVEGSGEYTSTNSTIILSGSWDDDLDTHVLYLYVDAKSPIQIDKGTDFTWSYELNLEIGLHSIMIYAFDEAGNYSMDSISIQVVAPIPGQNTYMITSQASGGGTISPVGAIAVEGGANQQFTIEADDGYVISTILVDDEPVEAESPYTHIYVFEDVSESHTISVRFLADPSWDSDGDGVPDTIDDYPHDAAIATPQTATRTGVVTIQIVSPTTATLSDVITMTADNTDLNMTDKPPNCAFPDGLVFFRVNNIEAGQTVEVQVTFPTPFSADASYYKVDSEGFFLFDDVVFSGQTVRLTLTDGGYGDADNEVNGVIEDPGGTAVFTRSDEVYPVTPVLNSGGSSGGCFIMTVF